MKRIVFVMSDTGHGHRAAAEAISAALKTLHGDEVQCDIVDVFKQYTPFPFRRFPDYYPRIMKRSARLYGVGFKLSNTPRRAQWLTSALQLLAHSKIQKLCIDYPADAIVSTHSMVTSPALSVFNRAEHRPLFFTVVVDLVSAHMFWYDKRSDLLLVPTQVAYQNGLAAGIPPERMLLTGMPVHPDFLDVRRDKRALREHLGWDLDLPAVLLVGGGDGMGKLRAIAKRINESRMPCQLNVITGRNVRLRRLLEHIEWTIPVRIYGFASNMNELMAASDLLLTKAGSLTISEACVVGLPLLIYDVLPGQEEGNVRYVIESGAGLYTPSISAMVRRMREFLMEDGSKLASYAENARKLGRPDAVWKIADAIWQQVAHQSAAPSTHR